MFSSNDGTGGYKEVEMTQNDTPNPAANKPSKYCACVCIILYFSIHHIPYTLTTHTTHTYTLFTTHHTHYTLHHTLTRHPH